IYEQAAPFSEGLACVYLDGKYGFIGKDGETELPFIYDQASSFTEGLAYFRMGEDYGFIDHGGNVVLRPDCDSVSSFREGRAYFSVDGLYGYLDKSGRIVVEPVYEDAGYFGDGLAMVMRNGCYGVMGIEGEEVLLPEYDDIDLKDGFIIAEKDGLKYCFDREGRQCLKEGWDSIEVWEGVFRVWRNDKIGLIDSDGKVLLEPEYDSLVPIPEKELVIVRNDGLYGVIDYAGKEKVSYIYSSISYDASGAGGLHVMCEETYKEGKVTYCSRSYGFLSLTEEGSFEEIAPVYDYMSSFVGDRAVVETQGKYGIIRRDGSLEYPIEYDSIRLYKNGSLALWTGDTAELIDSDGNVFHSGEYDYITLDGRGYSVEKDRKYGFLNEQGEQVIPMIYDRCYYVSVTNNIFGMRNYDHSVNDLLVKKDEGEETGLPEVFLQNHITPRAKAYMEFLQNGVWSEGQDYTLNLSELDEPSRNLSKLYRMGGEGELVLYFYAEPYEQTMFPMSDSGFFVFRDGKMEQLAAGEECGGSLRGDYICFWYDKEESRMKPGVYGSWGGFGGFAYGGTVYELQSEGAEVTASWLCVSQTRGNYDREELLESAELFYDDYGNAYTGETIPEAEYVTEYEVDGERTTIEHYEEVRDRYRCMGALDY
nr:WG repeat-containing protein [Acetatifactor sp.]